MGTAVSGAPEPELDAATKRFKLLLEKAWAARDAGEINRLETWLWLDGPGQPEGRVGGAARKLALDMNAIIIGNGVPETAGAASVDAWHRLAEIKIPVTVACGDLDVPFLVDRCRLLADRLPAARHHVLAGLAHQPYLESASTVAQLIRSAVTGGFHARDTDTAPARPDHTGPDREPSRPVTTERNHLSTLSALDRRVWIPISPVDLRAAWRADCLFMRGWKRAAGDRRPAPCPATIPLRLAGQASLAVHEVPAGAEGGRVPAVLAVRAIAKNALARWVCVPDTAARDLAAYAGVDRAEVVAAARAAGRYRRLRRPLECPPARSPRSQQQHHTHRPGRKRLAGNICQDRR